MWRLSSLASAVYLSGALVHQIALVPIPRPNEGAVAEGIYTNKYFHLSYPVPPGWMEGTAGPSPSRSGLYALRTLVPEGDPTGSIEITAQDMFFASPAYGNIMVAANEFRRTMAELPGMTIDRQPEEATIAGHPFGRVDFNGVGLFRSTWMIQIRCHLVSLNLMANSREQLDSLVPSLDKIAFTAGRDAESPDPVCLDDYINAENLVTKVDPEATGPTFTPIPVRIVVGVDGSVKNVHVIRATAGQRGNIERALAQWKFKPRETEARADDIEAGLIIEFGAGGTVHYPEGRRR
jgi:hypothetical protein